MGALKFNCNTATLQRKRVFSHIIQGDASSPIFPMVQPMVQAMVQVQRLANVIKEDICTFSEILRRLYLKGNNIARCCWILGNSVKKGLVPRINKVFFAENANYLVFYLYLCKQRKTNKEYTQLFHCYDRTI